MGYFPVRYDSRVVIYKRKVYIRLATDSPKVSFQTLPPFKSESIFQKALFSKNK